MRWAIAFVVVGAGIAHADVSVIGRWRVVGCATSPKDPADCARGKITFDASRWSVALPCCTVAHAYEVVTREAHAITISTDGVVSRIVIDAAGEARWNPILDGRVGELLFVRDANR